ncbi:MAG TPA: hypothetical protein VFN61_02435 [Acidimicrobiales bacterium]|nr:hypothetical protein [Acidimicrobiales bacterium]
MKRYNFDLEPVLRARRLQQDLARSDLQKANAAAQAAELAARSSLAHYQELTSTTPDAASFAAERQRGELAAGTLMGARRSLTAAKAAVDYAMQEYLRTVKAVSVLERLDERRREEHAVEVAREEAATVDDMVTSRRAIRRRQLNRGEPR